MYKLAIATLMLPLLAFPTVSAENQPSDILLTAQLDTCQLIMDGTWLFESYWLFSISVEPLGETFGVTSGCDDLPISADVCIAEGSLEAGFDASETLGCLQGTSFHVDPMPDMPDEVYAPGATAISGVEVAYERLSGVADGFVVGRIG